MSDRLPRFDVHAHFVPNDYRSAALSAGHNRPDGMPSLPEWNVSAALSLMDRQNIRTAFLSISSPGVHFGDDAAAAALARSVNDQGAALIRDHPGRFGLFAALPLPAVEAAIEEASRALDELGADGVVMETNHAGIYLGDARFDPLMAALDRRGAVIFLHPTSPGCSGCLDLALGQPRPVLEFMFETTRAVANLLYQGTLDRFPNLRVIVPHAGAALPVVVDRICDQAAVLNVEPPLDRSDVFASLRRLYYDTAGSPLPRVLPALLTFVDPGQILYGSDWPFTPSELVDKLAREIDTTSLLTRSTRGLVLMENALQLFPRLDTLDHCRGSDTMWVGG